MKRGISPLVGTILLIGFTIVLAALVFRWSGDFFQGTTEETGETIEEVMVLTGVDVDIINARASNPSAGCEGIEILIENNVEVLIDSFLVRITTSTETKSGTINESLAPFSSKWFNVDITCSGEIEKIELFPKVLINEKLVVPTDPAATFIKEVEQKEAYDPLPQSGLISYWSLDTNAADEGGINSNDGTINGATQIGGISGNALFFDGIDDYVDFGNDPSLLLTENFSISLWFNLKDAIDASSTHVGLIGKHGGGDNAWSLLWSDAANGKINFGTFSGEFVYTNRDNWNANEWHNLVLVYQDSTDAKIYIDGIEDIFGGDYIAGIITDGGTSTFKVGSSLFFGADRYFNGTIDEVAVWDRTLQESEIQDYYNSLAPIIPPPAAFKFLHITDPHIIVAGTCDPMYPGDGRTDCTECMVGNVLVDYVSECSTGVCQWINATTGVSLAPTIALQDIVQEANSLEHDFIIFTGDNVANEDCNENNSYTAFKEIADGLGTIWSDYYIIAANQHDNIDDPECQVYYEEVFGAGNLNWKFTKENNLFVGLSEISEGISSSRYNETFLSEALSTYQNQNKKLFLFHHIGMHCIDEHANSSVCGFRCVEDEIDAIIHGYKDNYKSIIVLSGHGHANIYEEYEGIHYFTTTATMNYPTEFRILEVGEDYINVTMSGSVNAEINAISQEIIAGAPFQIPLLTLLGEGTDREIYIDLTS